MRIRLPCGWSASLRSGSRQQRVRSGQSMSCWRAMRCSMGWSRASTAASCRSATTSSPPSRWRANAMSSRPMSRCPTPASSSTTTGCRRMAACCSAAASATRRRRRPTLPASCGRIWKRPFRNCSGCRIDHAWGGLVSVTTSRLPHVGHYGEVYFAHGYSGKGVILSTLSGKLLAEAITGDASRLDLFSTLTPDAVSRRHGAARPALCARHAVVRDARPDQALREARASA